MKYVDLHVHSLVSDGSMRPEEIAVHAAERGLSAFALTDHDNIAGDAAEGMLVTMPKRYDQDPANSAIVDALKAQKKDPSGPYVWITYAAVQSLATAMERTGSDDPLALIKDLKANGAKTVIGPLSWDEKGDLKGFEFGVFQWHADGSSTIAK